MKQTALAVLLSATAISSVLAQAKDFSGKWTVDADKTAAAAPKPESRYPTTEMQITMDAKTMTVVSKGPAGTRQTVYQLDGSPTAGATVSATGGRAGAGPETTAKWASDGALVITTKLYNGTGVMTYKREGTNLTLEYKSPGLPTPRVAIYKKVS